jgi:succinoglycan biosynthesis protein ExoM
MPLITIIIPTQRRPQPLALAARSAFAQAEVDVTQVELVVVDNDAVPSAKALTEALAAEAPFPVRYVHEPRSGVANARNAAMEAARGEMIAFLDDDEEASPGWLAALITAQARFDADVVFGPVRGRVPPSVTEHRVYLEQFFSRLGPDEAGVIPNAYGCGNSLMRRAALPDPLRPFSPRGNQIGGEDDLLFTAMTEAGARFAWAPDAWVWEDPAPDRLTLTYAIRRAFAYGQGAPSRCAAMTPVNRAGVAGWMVVGFGQGIVHGLVAGAKWLSRSPNRAAALDRAARGFGKTFWWKPFKIQFYGLDAGVTL